MSDNRIDQQHVLHYQQKLQYEIDSWDLNQALKKGEAVVVVDARSLLAYQQEHIPGAISFPHRMIDKYSVREFLKQGLDVLYVTYCDGIGCNASTKGALKLAELGFHVKELIGGLDWWKRDGYPVVAEVLQGGDCAESCGCG